MNNTDSPHSLAEYKINSGPEKDSAERMAKSLEPWRFSIPVGPILETGAGVGHFTEYLIKMFPERDIEVMDPDSEKIAFHNDFYPDTDRLTREARDPENDPPDELNYALICGHHTVQSFTQPATALERLSRSLKVDGLMLMSFPGEDSFKEWRSVCLDLGIPYTGRQLPQTEPLVIHLSMGPVQVDFYEDQSVHYFESFEDFLIQFKKSGVNAQKDDRMLTRKEIKLLNENWKERSEGRIGLTYHNVFLAVKRIAE
ncbi:methyltransferase domain-containing protein [Rhodohalobacter sp. SW132]|uniref:class I SAM-dependent methyltransferase n=1 Tax=Rhodohalobacter sp. SW132 TaxID=2293433 RepID=UPI000E2803C3|nr:class I SAM-dependent methyltransferase [Rhodohalobacter sp. SW132]REL38297.1 methyltransferase domain-containing protein [Rhodohalobacter sp. SW132]